MKFITTLNISSGNIMDKLYSGEISLQRGQWVKVGDLSARFVHACKTHVWVVYSGSSQLQKFKLLCNKLKSKK